jgi:hypothetical protein
MALSRRTVLRALLVVAIFVPTLWGQENTSLEIGGEWRGGAIVGVQTDPQQPGCSIFSYLERSVLLNPVPGRQNEVRGLWRRHTVSFGVGAQGCRWPSISASTDSTFESTLLYDVTDGTFDSSTRTLHMKTIYRTCFGNACATVPPAFRKSLDQSLQIRGESLVDTSVEAQESVVLLRTADTVEMEISAKKAAAVYDKLIDEGQFEQLRNDFSSFGSGSGAAEQMLTNLEQARQVVGRIVLRTPLSQLYACIWESQPTKTAKLVLLIQGVEAADSRRSSEIMALRQVGGEWGVDFVMFR